MTASAPGRAHEEWDAIVRTRWGIAGTGGIATAMSRALARVEGADLVAVASRSQERATAFASGRAVRAYSFEEMLVDPDVDLVYVASPHSEHCRQAVQALAAGKHVLVEKPAALSLAQTEAIVEAASSSGRFLLEGMWSRFLPAYDVLRDLLADGVIGEVREVHAGLGSALPWAPEHRIYRLDLGGGALLDLGVYPVQLALMLLGRPVHTTATADLGPTGVDHDTRVTLTFSGDRSATARCSLSHDLAGTARVVGTRGWIELAAPVYAPESLTYRRDGEAVVRVAATPGGDGWRFMVEEVQRCLALGVQQSPRMSWADSLLLATTLDAARRAIGLSFPNEALVPEAPPERHHRPGPAGCT